MNTPRLMETLITGFWLGATQISLGFCLMSGAGASSLMIFLLIAIWIAGSAAGVSLIKARIGILVFLFALALCLASRILFHVFPYGGIGTAVGLAAAFCCGGYAGSFLRTRTADWGEVRRVLLHENNGFIAGCFLGTCILFFSAAFLSVGAALLGCALLAKRIGWG
jgi:hypothetical protein